MKMLVHPALQEQGVSLAVPSALQSSIAPWASVDYRQYPFGSILSQQLSTKKININIFRFLIESPAVVYPFTHTPVLALQHLLQGNIHCLIPGYGEKRMREGMYELFYFPAGKNEAHLEPGDHECLHIELQPSYIEDAAETQPALKDLLQRLQQASAEGRPLGAAPIDFVVQHILKNLRSSNERDGNLSLQIQKYMLELLTHYLKQIKAPVIPCPKRPVQRRETLEKIRQVILNQPHIRQHTHAVLSDKYAISTSMIKRNFKTLFGVSPGAFLQEQAMRKAAYLLSTTNRNIDDIAYEIGYSDNSNFSKAFRNYYGKSPSEMRSSL